MHPFPDGSAVSSASYRLPSVRCSADELGIIRNRAKKANLTQSAYLRQVALSGSIIVQPSPYTHAFIQQLKRVGVNLNQIAHQLNRGGQPSEDVTRTLARLNTLIDEAIANRGIES